MVASPSVQTVLRSRLRVIRILLFAFGAIVGGLMVFLILGTLSSPLQSLPLIWRLTIGAVVALILALREVGWLSFPLPASLWQLPRQWNTQHSLASAFIYGVILGTGFLTETCFLGFWALYALALLIALPSSLWLGLWFGIGLSIPYLIMIVFAPHPDWHPELGFWVTTHRKQVAALEAVVLFGSALTWTMLIIGHT